jgi:hypothetical protein
MTLGTAVAWNQATDSLENELNRQMGRRGKSVIRRYVIRPSASVPPLFGHERPYAFADFECFARADSITALVISHLPMSFGDAEMTFANKGRQAPLPHTRTGRFWPYVGDRQHPAVVYDYTPTRERAGPENFLGNYRVFTSGRLCGLR